MRYLEVIDIKAKGISNKCNHFIFPTDAFSVVMLLYSSSLPKISYNRQSPLIILSSNQTMDFVLILLSYFVLPTHLQRLLGNSQTAEYADPFVVIPSPYFTLYLLRK